MHCHLEEIKRRSGPLEHHKVPQILYHDLPYSMELQKKFYGINPWTALSSSQRLFAAVAFAVVAVAAAAKAEVVVVRQLRVCQALLNICRWLPWIETRTSTTWN